VVKVVGIYKRAGVTVKKCGPVRGRQVALWPFRVRAEADAGLVGVRVLIWGKRHRPDRYSYGPEGPSATNMGMFSGFGNS
jgi:flagellar basal body rod protein FlgC